MGESNYTDAFYLTDNITTIHCDENTLHINIGTLQDQIKELKEALENLRDSLTKKVMGIASEADALTNSSKEKNDLEIFNANAKNKLNSVLDWVI